MPDVTSGPLQPPELATAAVLGGLTVALTIFGWFVPYASAVSILAVIPMAVTAFRCRTRAVAASAVAAAGVAFLLAGTGPLAGVAACAVVGGLVGHARRRSWGAPRTFLAALVGVAPLFAGVTDGVMAALPTFRKLTLAQLAHSLLGLTNVVVSALNAFVNVPYLGVAAHYLSGAARNNDHRFDTALRSWWATVPALLVVFTIGLTCLTWYLAVGILARLESVPEADLLDDTADYDAAYYDAVGGGGFSPRQPDPVPVVLTGISYRHGGADEDALSDVFLRVDPGRLTTVVGPNGSGKSTLVRILAGRPVTAGHVERPGGVGLGRIGGTALVSQRPESQVLGVRVADDVVWGLPPGTEVDVAEILATVGMAGMEDRDTSTLSGGELQRLTVAAALAHRPRLLLSDESTSMVDAAGRRALTGLFVDLPASRGMAVVHVTHRADEAAAADAVVSLERGRVVPATAALNGTATIGTTTASPTSVALRDSSPADFGVTPASTAAIRSWQAAAETTASPSVLRVVGVSHTYADRTPWAHRALVDVDFDVEGGAGVLVVGGNGSGKSTLAWIMAGLTRPTAGVCLLDDRPVDQQVGRVGLAFQHARLQLQRSTVRSDIRHAGGVDAAAADAALALVGLDPDELGDRPIDRLSGGQMRRVALAGILARRPRALVLDEPLAGLDAPARASLCLLLANLRSVAGLTLLVISHDLEGMEVVCDRVVELSHGRVAVDRALVAVSAPAVPATAVPATAVRSSARIVDGAGPTTGGGSAGAFDASGASAGAFNGDGSAEVFDGGTHDARPQPGSVDDARVRRRRRRPSFVLLRQVGTNTPIHRLWAGTKLVAVAALSLTLSIRPAWSTTALVAAVVVASAVAARIPFRALPRLPVALWLLLLLGAAFTLSAGGAPFVNVGGTRLGLGDLDSYSLFTLLSVVLFGASLMIGWTTSMGDVAPALMRLGRPLRMIRVPVEEWAVTMALCVRSLPLLIDELRTLVAARRLRPHFVDGEGKRDRIVDAIDLCSAGLVVALRRADEMGDAIRVRGGTTNFAARAPGPVSRDWVALLVIAVVCVAAFLIPT